MNNASFVGSFTGEVAAGVASLDPPLIQQTKSEIRSLAGEIAKLAHSTLEPAEFYRGFLPRLVTAMGAEGAAVWQTCDSLIKRGRLDCCDDGLHQSSLRLSAQHCLPDELLKRFADSSTAIEPSESHQKILECVIAEGTPILVPPHTVSIDTERPANPLEHSIIVIPVRIEDEVEFVLEVVQQPSGGPAAQRGYLRFVAQMADLMADYLRRQSLRDHAARADRIQQFEYWLTSIAQAKSPAQQLRTVADGLGELLDSFQVFIVRSGRRPKVLSASGLDSFDPRSETIMAVQLAERSVQQHSAPKELHIDLDRWKTGDERLTSVAKLYELMGSDRLIRLQLGEDSGTVAILATEIENSSTASPEEMLRVASSLFGLVDLHALQADWIRKWWPFRTSARTIQRKTRATWQVWTLRAAFAGIATVIAFFPVPQQITTTAVLSPKEKYCYYAPMDATVKAIFVEGRESVSVKANDKLLQLESTALNQSLSRLEAEANANDAHKEYLEFESTKAYNERRTAESRRFAAELKQLVHKIDQNKKEKAVVEAEKVKLTIVARENGELTSWDIKNRLENRPVARGELLLSTCNPEESWELQVSIPEHRVGLVSDTLARAKSQTVPMRFSLTSHPNVLMDGELTWLADQATRNAAGANVVLSRATVPKSLPLKKEGAIAHVTIDCGRVPAIWLVVRDAYWACMSRLKMIW